MPACHKHKPLRVLAAVALLGAAPAAHAQWAVVDVGAIAQLVQQVEILEQALATAKGELQQAQQSYQAMTGDRGMESLLGGTVRNYLPVSSSELETLLAEGSTPYGALSTAMQSALAGDAVLTPQELDRLSADGVAHLEAERRATALLQAIAGEALANSSGRFAALQQLIEAISSATDVKGSLDLQARISAEQGMLGNERTKLQVLYRALLAERWADRDRAREQVVAGHGDFLTRFQPRPAP